MKLSVVVITLNEAKTLSKALNSVKNLADEIVVVDSGSTDATVKIAIEFGAKVFFRSFDNYANQKNFAAGKAKGNWILSLDADEEISPGLAKEIDFELRTKRPELRAYSIPRRNIIFGEYIKYTRWQPELDRHVWLWSKGKGKWVGDVHEEVVVDGKIGKLKNPKIHRQYQTVSEFVEMMNRYSDLEADQKVRTGTNFSLGRFFFEPIYNFKVRLFYRLGFLDGWRGFVLSYLMAIYSLNVWIKIWERQK